MNDRYRGTLIGLAVGDALGTTLEFRKPGTFQPIHDLVGGGPFDLPAGKWTDDTSMALCLATSLIDNGFDVNDQISKYLQWYQNGYLSSTGTCFDIGITTQRALLTYQETGQAIAGSTDRKTAGNGSIMRLCPIAMFYRSDYEKLIIKAGISSKTTHAAPQAIDGCKYFGLLLGMALNGASKKELLKDLSSSSYWQKDPLDPELIPIIKGSFKEKDPPEIKGSGYIIESLEAALWAFHRSSSFEEGALKAVNLGDDADTTGAVYGQIAGAFYGMSAIPSAWLNKLHLKKEMEQMAGTLLTLSQK